MSQEGEFDLPSELWFKIIAFVLSDTIHSICCSPEHVDLSWDRHAFGTLRLVSLAFSNHVVKVAELALSVPHSLSSQNRDGAVEPQGDTNMVGDSDAAKLKALYDKFKLLDSIRSGSITDPGATFFAVNGVSLISAYYGYVHLIKNVKLVFTRDSMAWPHNVEKIYHTFPVALRNISIMLDIMTVPEMVGRLRKDVERDVFFISSGLEIIYNLSLAVTRQEWDFDLSESFQEYLNDLYETMKRNTEFYNTGIKEQEPGCYPTILRLPGVHVAKQLILSCDSYHKPLADLVRTWT